MEKQELELEMGKVLNRNWKTSLVKCLIPWEDIATA